MNERTEVRIEAESNENGKLEQKVDGEWM